MLTDLALVAHLSVWIIVATLCLLVWVLARQLSLLYTRIAPAGALMVNPNLQVGEPAPDVQAQRLGGEEVTVGARAVAAGRKARLLVFLSPDCPISRSLLPALRSLGRVESWLDITLASDGGDRQAHETFVRDEKLSGFDYLVSEELGRVYGVSKIPYGVLIDERGQLAALGIVNSREHLESLLEAKERNIASLQDFMMANEANLETTNADQGR